MTGQNILVRWNSIGYRTLKDVDITISALDLYYEWWMHAKTNNLCFNSHIYEIYTPTELFLLEPRDCLLGCSNEGQLSS